MSKFAENVIKFAYENRANAMIAAKQAADEKGLIEKISAWLERNPQAKRGLISGGVAGIGGASAYGITRALGGSKGKAWTAAGITAPVAGGISEAALNRKEIGDFLKKLLYGKHEPLTTKSPILPSEKQTADKMDEEAGKGNYYGSRGAQEIFGRGKKSNKSDIEGRFDRIKGLESRLRARDPQNTNQAIQGALGSIKQHYAGIPLTNAQIDSFEALASGK